MMLHTKAIYLSELSLMQRKSTDMVAKSKDVNTEGGAGNFPAKFSNGMEVEVKSNDEGYEGSWFTATIVESRRNNTYIIQYETLKTDDETEFLKEKADASCIRPRPPQIPRVLPFKMYEEVDAWYNEGWWQGRVSRILDGSAYEVYFSTTNETLQFDHCDLRPHLEWDNGNWITLQGWYSIHHFLICLFHICIIHAALSVELFLI